MANYIFDTHYNQCSLADTETGIVIEWTTGDFNGTQKTHFEGTILPENKPEMWLARKMREMGDYIVANYSDFI